jgi:hypothetical protein
MAEFAFRDVHLPVMWQEFWWGTANTLNDFQNLWERIVINGNVDNCKLKI